MKTTVSIILISFLLLSCYNNTKQETIINQDTEIANVVINSTNFIDSTLFLISEQPMFYGLAKHDTILEVDFYGLNTINLASFSNSQIDTAELTQSFTYEHHSIYGQWSNSVRNIDKVSYTEIPKLKKDSVFTINWEEINNKLGYGFLVLSKPILVNNDYAFIGLHRYTNFDFISVLYFLENKDNEWTIIDYDASYFELIEAHIKSDTSSFPINPYSMVVIGKIEGILK